MPFNRKKVKAIHPKPFKYCHLSFNLFINPASGFLAGFSKMNKKNNTECLLNIFIFFNEA